MIGITCFISPVSLEQTQFSTDLSTDYMIPNKQQVDQYKVYAQHMHSFAVSLGWRKFKECMCPGYPEHRYNHPGLNASVLKIFPTKNTWAYYDKWGRRVLEGNNEIFDISLTKITP
jgi:hypothetical protein